MAVLTKKEWLSVKKEERKRNILRQAMLLLTDTFSFFFTSVIITQLKETPLIFFVIGILIYRGISFLSSKYIKNSTMEILKVPVLFLAITLLLPFHLEGAKNIIIATLVFSLIKLTLFGIAAWIDLKYLAFITVESKE